MPLSKSCGSHQIADAEHAKDAWRVSHNPPLRRRLCRQAARHARPRQREAQRRANAKFTSVRPCEVRVGVSPKRKRGARPLFKCARSAKKNVATLFQRNHNDRLRWQLHSELIAFPGRFERSRLHCVGFIKRVVSIHSLGSENTPGCRGNLRASDLRRHRRRPIRVRIHKRHLNLPSRITCRRHIDGRH